MNSGQRPRCPFLKQVVRWSVAALQRRLSPWSKSQVQMRVSVVSSKTPMVDWPWFPPQEKRQQYCHKGKVQSKHPIPPLQEAPRLWKREHVSTLKAHRSKLLELIQTSDQLQHRNPTIPPCINGLNNEQSQPESSDNTKQAYH